jgi:4,5-DOPA dioxygenase extradiol
MIPSDMTAPAVPPAPTFSTISPVFISHGSPMLMLAPGAAGRAWAALAASVPRPRAILAVSAHWMTRVPAVSAAPRPETIHDFYGFPDALYDIRYEPPGAVDLAREVEALVPGIAVDPRRGLDHGAWVPLRSMAPAADIPVAQFAVMPGRSAEDRTHRSHPIQSPASSFKPARLPAASFP